MILGNQWVWVVESEIEADFLVVIIIISPNIYRLSVYLAVAHTMFNYGTVNINIPSYFAYRTAVSLFNYGSVLIGNSRYIASTPAVYTQATGILLLSISPISSIPYPLIC